MFGISRVLRSRKSSYAADDDIKQLNERLQKSDETNVELEKCNELLDEINTKLELDIRKLVAKNVELDKNNTRLREHLKDAVHDRSGLQQRVIDLENTIKEIEHRTASLVRETSQLVEENKKLTACLQKYFTSSKK